MIKIPFFKKKESILGMDIGTFSTKITHLSYYKGEKATLENYGEKFNELKKEDFYQNIRKKTFPLSFQEISEDIKSILIKAKIKEKRAVFSIPDFMTFFTVFKIPFMSKEEMDSAIRFEAKQHIPMPLNDVSLDWSIIEEQNKEAKIGPKIILVAVPNKVVNEYQKIADLSGVELKSIEAEVFSLARALNNSSEKKVIQLIDVGIQSTTISVIEEGLIKSVFSVDFSESEIIKNIAQNLGISYNEVEEIKEIGNFNEGTKEGKIMCYQINNLVKETNRVFDNFTRTERKNIDEIILTGGLVLSPGFKDYFEKKIKRKTSIINPFAQISYSPELENKIIKMGPRYAVSIGLALRNNK